MKAVTMMVEKIDNGKTGEAARMERLAIRASQSDIAAFMGVSPMFICSLELGRKNWTPDKVDKFNQAIAYLSEKRNVSR